MRIFDVAAVEGGISNRDFLIVSGDLDSGLRFVVAVDKVSFDADSTAVCGGGGGGGGGAATTDGLMLVLLIIGEGMVLLMGLGGGIGAVWAVNGGGCIEE